MHFFRCILAETNSVRIIQIVTILIILIISIIMIKNRLPDNENDCIRTLWFNSQWYFTFEPIFFSVVNLKNSVAVTFFFSPLIKFITINPGHTLICLVSCVWVCVCVSIYIFSRKKMWTITFVIPLLPTEVCMQSSNMLIY